MKEFSCQPSNALTSPNLDPLPSLPPPATCASALVLAVIPREEDKPSGIRLHVSSSIARMGAEGGGGAHDGNRRRRALSTRDRDMRDLVNDMSAVHLGGHNDGSRSSSHRWRQPKVCPFTHYRRASLRVVAIARNLLFTNKCPAYVLGNTADFFSRIYRTTRTTSTPHFSAPQVDSPPARTRS